MKKSEDKINAFKKDLINQQKEVKVKEKAIYQLEKKCENLNTNNKKFKSEIAKVKIKNKKLLKAKAKSGEQNARSSSENLALASPSRSCSSDCSPPQHGCVEPATVPDEASGPADLRLHPPPTPPGYTTYHASQKACDNENNFVVENINNKDEI